MALKQPESSRQGPLEPALELTSIKTVYIPKPAEFSSEWSMLGGNHQQDFVPADDELHMKLGLGETSRNYAFAGSFGDWANALHVDTYTDIDPAMAAYARKRFGPGLLRQSNIKNFLTENAADFPRRPGEFDWGVSFEPYPLLDSHTQKDENGTFTLALLRGLLNRKGVKVIYNNGGKTPAEALRDGRRMEETPWLMGKVAEVYGAAYDDCDQYISGKQYDPERRRHHASYASHTIHTLISNDSSRAKAAVDLALLWRLHDSDIVDKASLTSFLGKQGFALDDEALGASIRRINGLFGELYERNRRNVTLR